MYPFVIFWRSAYGSGRLLVTAPDFQSAVKHIPNNAKVARVTRGPRVTIQ